MAVGWRRRGRESGHGTRDVGRSERSERGPFRPLFSEPSAHRPVSCRWRPACDGCCVACWRPDRIRGATRWRGTSLQPSPGRTGGKTDSRHGRSGWALLLARRPVAGILCGACAEEACPGRWHTHHHLPRSKRNGRKLAVSGRIIYSAWLSALMEVSADGGTPEPVMRLSQDDTVHNFPHVLPDGKAALFATSGRVGRRPVDERASGCG